MLPSKYSPQAIFKHHFQYIKCSLYSIKYSICIYIYIYNCMQTSKGQTEGILRHWLVQLVHFQKQSFNGIVQAPRVAWRYVAYVVMPKDPRKVCFTSQSLAFSTTARRQCKCILSKRPFETSVD
jgi:hypothetical protein